MKLTFTNFLYQPLGDAEGSGTATEPGGAGTDTTTDAAGEGVWGEPFNMEAASGIPPAPPTPQPAPANRVPLPSTRETNPAAAIDSIDEPAGVVQLPDGSTRILKARERPRGRGPAMAQVQAQVTQAPGLGLLRDAYQQQVNAQNRLTDAVIQQEAKRADVLNETADAMEAESLRLGEMRERAMQDSIAQTRRLQEQADEIGATAPQAGRLFGTSAQAASFGAALSIAAGAMLSTRVGSQNVALKIIDQAIARDMEVQKEAMRNQQFASSMGLNLAQEMRAQYRDDLAASNAMQATLLRYTENRLAAIVAQTNDPVLRARGDAAIADIQVKYATLAEEVTRQTYGIRMAMPLRQAQQMIAASAGQSLAPQSAQDTASEAAGGAVGQAQAAAEAVGQNARRAAQAAKRKAQGAAKVRQRRRRRRASQPGPASYTVELGRFPTDADIANVQAQAQRQHGPNYRAFRTGNKVVIADMSQFSLEGVSPALRKERAALRPVMVAIPKGISVPTGTGRIVGGEMVRVDPGAYAGGAKALRDDQRELNALNSAYNQFQGLVQKILDKEGTKFMENKAARSLINSAIGIYNKALGGGVLDRSEYERYADVFRSPDDWSWGPRGLDPNKAEERKEAWRNATQLFRSRVEGQINTILNNGQSPIADPVTVRNAPRLRERRPGSGE